jgi:hypothetical protein
LRIAILLRSFFTAKLAKKKTQRTQRKKVIEENENGNKTISLTIKVNRQINLSA